MALENAKVVMSANYSYLNVSTRTFISVFTIVNFLGIDLIESRHLPLYFPSLGTLGDFQNLQLRVIVD